MFSKYGYLAFNEFFEGHIGDEIYSPDLAGFDLSLINEVVDSFGVFEALEDG